jgi:hypothetical protein
MSGSRGLVSDHICQRGSSPRGDRMPMAGVTNIVGIRTALAVGGKQQPERTTAHR